jgi:subtilase family serine protease
MTTSCFRSSVPRAVPLTFAVFASACAVPDAAVTTTMTADQIARASHARVCTSPRDQVHCHARVLVDASGQPVPNATPAGFGPSQLRSAYKITGSGSSSITIAIASAFGYLDAESDLATYRSQFGLPACSSSTGCFRQVNQTGGTTFPAFNLSWAREAALDLDMASAICPNCKLLLVEANDATFADLAAAVNEAVSLGAHVVTNSYGGDETGTTSFEAAFNHTGVAIIASTGDSGFFASIEFPASSPHVTAVGGTTLTAASTARGWSETAWSGAGSGCSAVYSKPSWQHDTGCSRRTLADVSAVADPNTGVAAFAPTSETSAAWMVFGGTSVAAPLIGGVYAVNGGAVSFGSDPYAHTSALFDVTSGSTGSCSPSYLCTAKVGYDGPTGLGTPNGTVAF